MHPLHSEQLAIERHARLLQEARQARLVRSAKHRRTARLRVRTLEPSDIVRIAALYNGLSPRSRFLRFMSPIQTISIVGLEHLANIDHDDHEAIGAFDRGELVASAHWFRSEHRRGRADIALEVADRYQRRGVGSRLLTLLRRRARSHDIAEFGATLAAENTGAIALLRATGWPVVSTFDGAALTVTMAIDTPRPS
jgi:ribosomal protein S18 acetylase RimI-like enzyme